MIYKYSMQSGRPDGSYPKSVSRLSRNFTSHLLPNGKPRPGSILARLGEDKQLKVQGSDGYSFFYFGGDVGDIDVSRIIIDDENVLWRFEDSVLICSC